MGKRKVEIVEDNPILSNSLKEAMEDAGFDVTQAFNGEIGLKKALEEKPDIILLDLLLPKMKGMDMLKKMREDKWGKSVPVIILSVVREASTISEALGEDVFAYLIKDYYTLSDIVELVQSKLNS